MPSLTHASRLLYAARAPMLFYVSLRALTCLLPFVHHLPLNPPTQDAQVGPGLEFAVLALLLTLFVSLTYALLVGSLYLGGYESIRSRRSLLVVAAIGALDLASGLAIVAYTDGWSSQFRHYVTTALLFPCLALGLRRSMLLASASIVVIYLGLLGSLPSGPTGDLLYLQIGWAVSIVVISGVIGYLGDVVYDLQRSRRSAEIARDNLETMLEITQYTAMVTSGLNDLMLRMARAIGERHSYGIVGIYVIEGGGDDVRLAGWQGEFETLRRHAGREGNLVHEAIEAMDARLAKDGQSWNAAIPIRDSDSPVGVLLIGAEGPEADVTRMTGLGNALVGHIAVGIQVARLRQRLDRAVTDQEWERITRQIHDRISSSLFSLMLYLETYAEQAKQDGSPLHRRLDDMITPFSQLLIETRQYMYHLLPALRGEMGLDMVVDSMIAEFERTSEIPVQLTIGGSAASVPAAATAGLYRILQYRLSEILLNSTATRVEINLSMDSDTIFLNVFDDGVEDLAVAEVDRIREMAGDIGGDLRLASAHGGGTEMVLDLTIDQSRGRLDHTSNN